MNVEVIQIFDEISNNLNEFAKSRNLLIEKYWHNFPSWAFSFKHPKGGVARLEVMLEDNNSMKIYGYWWIDNYENGIRYSKRYESDSIQVNKVSFLLEDVFKLILEWELDTWSEITEGYKEVWHPIYTEKQFTMLNGKYPSPNL